MSEVTRFCKVNKTGIEADIQNGDRGIPVRPGPYSLSTQGQNLCTIVCDIQQSNRLLPGQPASCLPGIHDQAFALFADFRLVRPPLKTERFGLNFPPPFQGFPQAFCLSIAITENGLDRTAQHLKKLHLSTRSIILRD
jgi:hypothetical protein